MVRLTLELILQAPQYLNPNKEWTLSLRGCKIPAVENLGATQDHFDCVDLTDNELLKLDNIPPLSRLSSLVLCNNRISRIDPEAIDSIPNLSSLILTNNKLDLLTDLLPIFRAKKLERVSLVGNGVCERAYYRLFVIFHLPNLRFLDFKHVTQKERQQATRTFAGEAGARLVKEIAPPRKQTRRPSSADGGQRGGTTEAAQPHPAKNSPAASAEHVEKIKLAIARASTTEEIARLENALRLGRLSEVIAAAGEKKKGKEEKNAQAAAGGAAAPAPAAAAAPAAVPAEAAAEDGAAKE